MQYSPLSGPIRTTITVVVSHLRQTAIARFNTVVCRVAVIYRHFLFNSSPSIHGVAKSALTQRMQVHMSYIPQESDRI